MCERVQAMLRVIPADTDRDQWARVLMAVKSELGEDGFPLVDEWSSTAGNYDPRAVRDTWRSVREDGAITGATLFHLAQQHGYNGAPPTPTTAKELAERRRRLLKAEAERQARQEKAAERAVEILKAATGDPASHPYALKKGVLLGKLVKRGRWPQRGWEDALLVPIYEKSGRITTVQAIDPKGNKDLLAGGLKKGCFHPLGKIRGAPRVLIGEGLATVAAGVAATGIPGVMAIDAGNLLAVGKVVRELVAPGADLLFLADDDKEDSQ